MEILIINSGSSSLKYQLIDSVTGESKAKGIVDRIGIDGSLVKYTAIKNGKEVEVKGTAYRYSRGRDELSS